MRCDTSSSSSKVSAVSASSRAIRLSPSVRDVASVRLGVCLFSPEHGERQSVLGLPSRTFHRGQTQAEWSRGDTAAWGNAREEEAPQKNRHNRRAVSVCDPHYSLVTRAKPAPRRHPGAGKHKHAWRRSPPGGLVDSNARVVTRAALHAPTSRV